MSTPTFIINVLHLVTYVQLFKMTAKVKEIAYTLPAYIYWVGFYDMIQF